MKVQQTKKNANQPLYKIIMSWNIISERFETAPFCVEVWGILGCESRLGQTKVVKQVVRSPVPNSGQQVWVLRVHGDDFYKLKGWPMPQKALCSIAISA